MIERYHDLVYSLRCRRAGTIRAVAGGLVELAGAIQPEPCWYREGRWGADDREGG